MAYFAPNKASEDAISILNRVLHQERAISQIENERIIKNLQSVKKSGHMLEYYSTAACYYSISGDIKNLKHSVNAVFDCKYATTKDKLQMLFALNNAMRYNDIYEKLHYFDENDFIDSSSSVDTVLGSLAINFKFDEIELIKEKLKKPILEDKDIQITLALSQRLKSFLKKKDNLLNYKEYINNILDWYSINLLRKAKETLGQAYLNYSFYDDEAIDFMSIAIEFKNGDIDDLLDVEEELISYIARAEFPSELKSTVGFCLRFRNEEDDGDVKEKVEVYD